MSGGRVARLRARLARWVLRAYPRDFRKRHGRELLDFWASQASEARYRGMLGRLRLAMQIAVDAMTAGFRLRAHANREGEGMMKSIWTDLRFARRSLAGAPLFTTVAVATMALGIAASTAVFAVVEGVVLRPLPYPDADRLVRVLRTQEPDRTPAVAWPDFRDWRDRADHFEGLAAFAEAGDAFEWESGAEVVPGALVTRDFFDVMGVPLALGRSFSPEEDRFGGADAIILSHGLWLSRFGGDPDVLGRTVPYGGQNVPIVGVAAPGFDAPYDDTRYWIPLQDDELLARVGLPTGGRSLSFLRVMGRLAPDADATVAQASLRDLASRIDDEVGKGPEQASAVALVPLADWLVGDVRATLAFLLASAVLVLVVAGANVAGLALSRSAGRTREIAVRVAVGAGRGRLLRQLMVESTLLCGIAGAIGLLLATAFLGSLVALAPEGLPRAAEVRMTPISILFACAVSAVSVAVVGVMPALAASRVDLSAAVSAGRRASEGRRAIRPQRLLVSFQVATAVVLLTGAALLSNSFLRLLSVDPGFDGEAVVVASVQPPEARYETPEAVADFYARLLDGVRALPGVSSASTTYSPPLFGNDFWTTVRVEGEEDDEENRRAYSTVIVGGDYFEANGIPLIRGRDFGPGDRLGEPPVVIVNETMAQRLWPGDDPIGKRIVYTGGLRGSAESFDPRFFPEEPMTVVGVAGDVRRSALKEAPAPEYYRPHAQLTWGFQYLLVRGDGHALSAAARIRDAVRAIDPNVPVLEITALDARVAEARATDRFRMVLLVTFASLTGLLAVVGLYSVMALTVARRIREMGIRIALGARRHDVVRGTLLHGLRLVVVGAAAGLAVAWTASRLLASMLFEVQPTEPAVYAGVLLLTAFVGTLACYGPARRAGHVDPVVSLRAE